MSRKKLLDDIKQNPGRIYKVPHDVLRDRRFSDADRLEILKAWRDATGEDIGAVIEEAQQRLALHAAE